MSTNIGVNVQMTVAYIEMSFQLSHNTLSLEREKLKYHLKF